MSSTGARVLTAVVLIPLVVWLVLWGPTWLVAIVVAGIILLALHEFFALGAKIRMPGYPLFTMLCALGIVWAMAFQTRWERADAGGFPNWFEYLLGSPEFYLVFFLLGTASLALVSKRGMADALPSGAVSGAGVLFIAWPLSYLVRLHALSPKFLLLVLVLVWAGDTAAFFVGRSIGRHLLAPTVSPKKTWEGAIANVLGTILAAYVFSYWMPRLTVYLIILAGLVSVAGQVGDLFESAWKRGAGVKDSGSLLPGHGGILDRIDALLLAVPVVWWYFSKVPLPK
ncbi:MAG: phosphatidate cytidylyltransferase [Acidobacteria bacterium]|nr:phosphatidate cytidylyltransferase [Acidobacteriota bacterium]MCL5286620.1 phosphatidate cytidylyltransferase [Acidobacteriota bacterium]